MRTFELILTVTVWACCSFGESAIFAQFINPSPIGVPPNTYQLHPQKEPLPALTYSLLPKHHEQHSGNAAVVYRKLTAEQQRETIEMLEMPLTGLRDHESASDVCPESVYETLREAATCQSCDWTKHAPLEDRGVSALKVARMIAARARYQIANADFDNAIESLQTGYAMAHQIGNNSNFTQLLRGISIKTIMDRELECLIQQPGAPNLYWAIAGLPQPFFPIQRTVLAAAKTLETRFPELQHLTDETIGEKNDEFWMNTIKKIVEQNDSSRPSMRELKRSNGDTWINHLVANKHKPAQKSLLISGLSPVQIKRLSPVQAVLLGSVREFQADYSNAGKWVLLPYDQAKVEMEAHTILMRNRDEKSRILNLASPFASIIQQIMSANARSNRQTAILQTMEAIRHHLGQNKNLPNEIAELTQLPAPRDPVTGRPFQSKLADGKLAIFGPRLPSGALDLWVAIEKD